MGRGVARKLIESHLVDGDPEPGAEIGIRVDQTLTQDATGTLVMQELEALGLDRARTEILGEFVEPLPNVRDLRRELRQRRAEFIEHAGRLTETVAIRRKLVEPAYNTLSCITGWTLEAWPVPGSPE